MEPILIPMQTSNEPNQLLTPNPIPIATSPIQTNTLTPTPTHRLPQHQSTTPEHHHPCNPPTSRKRFRLEIERFGRNLRQRLLCGLFQQELTGN